jgi:hypothetical protein
MVYNIVVDQLDCWFAAFKQQGGWKLSATKGATRQDLEQLLSTPSNP